MASLAERGAAALRAGDIAAARALLVAAVRERPDDARAWLWLSGALDEPARQRYCLERALALDPSSAAARRGLEALAQEPRTKNQGTRGADQTDALPLPGGASTDPGAAVAQGQTTEVRRTEYVARQSAMHPDGAPPVASGSPGGRQARSLSSARRGSRPALSGVLPWLSAALAGVGAVLGWVAWAGLGAGAPPLAILWAAVAGGVPLGLAALLLGGVLLRTSGRWLGGRAGAAEIRAALGWAAAPAACGVILWGAQLALLPGASFGGAANAAQLLLARAAAAAHVGLWLWAAARSVRGLAGAHGLGAARAAASWLLAALIVVAAAFAVLGGAALVIGLRGG